MKKPAKKNTSTKASAKAAKPAKAGAAKSAPAKGPSPKSTGGMTPKPASRPPAAAVPDRGAGRYTPGEIQGVGWKPFRYPPE
jgi:hypothetical protein